MSSKMLESVNIDPGVVLVEKDDKSGAPNVRSGGKFKSLKNQLSL